MFKYLKYLLRHKWLVLWYGLDECDSLYEFWNLLIHDWDKFLPASFLAFGSWFYHGPFTTENSPRPKAAFYKEWAKHTRTNKHHWEYWVYRWDGDGPQVAPMPPEYMREMLADWKAVAKAYNRDLLDWYESNKDCMVLHPFTRSIVEYTLTGYIGYTPWSPMETQPFPKTRIPGT